jgi:preprotein translocase subunit SecA
MVAAIGAGRKADYAEEPQARPAGMAVGAEGQQLPQGAQPPERPKTQETYRRDSDKVGRNDPCPCGSGKKYKNCCGKLS